MGHSIAQTSARRERATTLECGDALQKHAHIDIKHWLVILPCNKHSESADFVALMLPHHQAAIDMARIELTFGTDPQLRRLAQEIVTDQESEIQLMKLWREQHTCDGKSARKPCTKQRKEW